MRLHNKAKYGVAPPSQRFELRKDTILLDLDLTLRTNRDNFACERDVTAGAPGAAAPICASPPFALERSRHKTAKDGVDDIGLGVLLEGVGTQSQGGRVTSSQAPHVARPGMISTVLCSSSVWDLQAPSAVSVLRRPPVVLFTGCFSYVAAVPTMQPADVETGLAGSLHLRAGLLARTSSLAGGAAADTLAPTTDPDLDVDRMLRDPGVSRTQLNVASADSGGIWAAIREARLQRVRARLCMPGGTIEKIAFAAGVENN